MSLKKTAAEWIHCKKCGDWRSHFLASPKDSGNSNLLRWHCSLCGALNNNSAKLLTKTAKPDTVGENTPDLLF